MLLKNLFPACTRTLASNSSSLEVARLRNTRLLFVQKESFCSTRDTLEDSNNILGKRENTTASLKGKKENNIASPNVKFEDDIASLSVRDQTDLATLKAEPENDVDEVSKLSERKHFLEDSDHLGKKIFKPPPIQKCLNYTNKFLFGPLLETADEKKRRLRQGQQPDAHYGRKKKTTLKKGRLEVLAKPLAFRAENKHFSGTVVGHSALYPPKYQNHTSKRRIVLKQAGDPSISSIVERKFTQNNFIKQSPNMVLQSVNSPPKKLIVTSWSEEKEKEDVLSMPVTKNGNGGTTSIHQEYETKLDTISTIQTTGALRNGNEVGHRDTIKDDTCVGTNVKGDISYISVDTSKFSAVPSLLDINSIETFPLYNNNGLMTDNCKLDTEQRISTIGIFDNGYQKLPSVRKILDATMPTANRIALQRWQAKMIRELGQEGFEQYRKGLLDRGVLLHGCIQSELSGVPPSVEDLPTIDMLWVSLKRVLPEVSDVRVLESRVIHPHLHYQGAVDCVANYRGMPMVIEWKTSSKPKLSVRSMFDDPIQVIAYLGALNFDDNYQLPYQASAVMLVAAYDSGLPAHTHILSREHCEETWRKWCSRLAQFWRQLEKNE